ncbi:MAG: hypothetical protein DRJ03_22975 [Chloroflexi bacterium]|nr:MAG: hypothetical protein DRI81_13230 [Chloroflexota bacterium]RLC79731.1 MAG: hypothetical protein DRJ03_22975 [Chloroflexota bacterium]
MLPTLEFGPWQVGTYQITSILALTLCGTWTFRRLLSLGHPPGVIVRGLFLTIVGGFAATYLVTYLINTLRTAHSGFWARPEGLSIIWALVSGIGVAAIYCQKQGISLSRALDMAVLPTVLGLAIGRLGCTAAGCCYGRPTDSWLGVYLPDDNGLWAMRYPTQLMAAAANLTIFFILRAIERHGVRRVGKERGWPYNGFLTSLGLFLYSLKRFALAFLRQAGTFSMIGPFSWMHVNALIGITVTATLILWNLHRARRKEVIMP